VTAVSTTLGWRLVNERMPKEWTVSLGEANEQLAEKFAISRERQDEFAARSHNLADAAWTAGFYDDLVVPVATGPTSPGTRASGRGPRREAGRAQAGVPPDGTITAGNASPLNDGASAVLLGSRPPAGAIGSDPLARIAGRGALEPQMFGYAPVEAASRALKRAGITWSDVGAVELNEAFAVQSLACVDAWKIDPGDRQRQGRRDRHRPPARRLRRPASSARSPTGCGVRRAVGRRGDLHRRRPGARRRPGERHGDRTMTIRLRVCDATRRSPGSRTARRC
jgi:acetyl-CoA acetyltransferase